MNAIVGCRKFSWEQDARGTIHEERFTSTSTGTGTSTGARTIHEREHEHENAHRSITITTHDSRRMRASGDLTAELAPLLPDRFFRDGSPEVALAVINA